MLSAIAIMMIGAFSYCYAECHYSECRYAEYRGAHLDFDIGLFLLDV